jgi:rare lipoprotein A
MTARLFALAVIVLALTGCGGHHRRVEARVPPAPPIQTSTSNQQPPEKIAPSHSSHSHQPLYVEVGWASWYGPSYNHRRAANGEIYDQDQLTAAHRTIPLNSVARVTNIATNESVVVRITDRGPFAPNRIIDLSMAAAKRVSVYLHGTAKVKIEVLESPASIESGGRWAVQMGAFDAEDVAAHMKAKLAQRYRDAKVLKFVGPRHDWWVRVRVPNDDKREAAEIARDTRPPEGGVYLVRLD